MSEVVEFTSKEDWLDFVSAGDSVTDFARRMGCIPCQRLEPQYKNAAARVENVNFATVYMDEVDSDFLDYIMDDLGIRGTPTILRFTEGERVGEVKGRTAPLIIKELSSE